MVLFSAHTNASRGSSSAGNGRFRARRAVIACGLAMFAMVSCGSSPEPGVEVTGDTRIAGNVMEVLQADQRFGTLVSALNVDKTGAGLQEQLDLVKEATSVGAALKAGTAFTVFAPTDKAFEALSEEALAALLKDPEQLAAILANHVVVGKLGSSEILADSELETLGGGTLAVDSDGLAINGVAIIEKDLPATNGVIHVIDALIEPAE